MKEWVKRHGYKLSIIFWSIIVLCGITSIALKILPGVVLLIYGLIQIIRGYSNHAKVHNG